MAKRGENIRKRADGRWEGRYIEAYRAYDAPSDSIRRPSPF